MRNLPGLRRAAACISSNPERVTRCWKEGVMGSMRRCSTGRTRVLLPPAPWRRAQLQGHLRITANKHRHLRRTRTRSIESVLCAIEDVHGTDRRQEPAVVSSQYLVAVLRNIPSENFETRLLFQGASLIEPMRRCPLSNGRLPSKRRTPQLPNAAFFISRTSRFPAQKRTPDSNSAGPAYPKTAVLY